MEVLTMVGGAVLAPLFESLLAELRSNDVLSYARNKGVEKELCKWEETLKTIKAVLEKAEEQQRTDESVKIWFDELQDLAYDVEDLLDEFNTKAKLESKAGTSKVAKHKRADGVFEVECRGKQRPMKDNGTFKLTSSEVNEANVYGREEDQKKIVDQLKVEARDGRMRVIPIVGMGGLGKTTLAQLVYNDASLQFEFKAWVTVGESFDVLTITKAIVRQFGGDLPEDFSHLQARLKEKLSGKKALVVLDDLWITDKEYQNWTLFSSPFKAGSSIIVTTRNQTVARITSTTDGYVLQELSSDNCVSILANHALERKDFNEYPHLKELGEQIAKRCDGLPLAAKALGGVLRGKKDTNSWEEVLNNKIWEEGNSVLRTLQLSYYHLPSHLKRCFSYTAIFPKDYEFDKTRLVPLWLGEGFVKQIKDGYKCFDELLARSFFQRSSSDESLYVMHDLMNDLARFVSGNFCFNLDEEPEKLCAKVRYSAFNCHEYDRAPRFERFHEMKRLRTFLPLRHGDSNYLEYVYYSSPTMLDVIIKKFGWLRVLVLPYAINELPTSIESLKHLRCLDISYAPIEVLPESLCKLFNLKALILFRCKKLCKLPKDFCSLINLQCLDIRGTANLKEMPLGIGNLKNLHILGKFVLGKCDGSRMLDLLKIPNLQVQQHISALKSAINVPDVESWKMRQLEGINRLTLEWNSKLDDSYDEKNEEEVLSALKPHKNIMELSIKSYGGRELASWIGDYCFDKLKILELQNCFNVVSLPALGKLPSLEELTIEGMNGIKKLGMTFYENVPSLSDVFPCLKTLRIRKMKELYEWSHYSNEEGRRHVFPKLKKLELMSCPKLEKCNFPFTNLDELEVHGCKEAVLRSKSNLHSLTKLKITWISGLESLSGTFFEGVVSLQEMVVHSCGELKHLWEDEFSAERLKCLKNVEIWCCGELVSLVEEDEGNFPLNLERLFVYQCEKLEKLPNQLHSLASLTSLEVICCPKLETFLMRGLPRSLKLVNVDNCSSLVSLAQGIIVDNPEMSGVEKLTINGCNALILRANLGFPASLRDLDIRSSPVGAQLLTSLQQRNGLSRLTYLRIQSCPDLESFPDSAAPIPTLLGLRLCECENLRSLPNQLNQFTSLRTLEMYDCPQVASFPEGGLPTNLKGLHMVYCDKLESKVMLERSLNALAHLERVTIAVGGGMDDVSSFPHHSLLLPASLTSLAVRGFQNLRSIAVGIQKLTTLKELSICECPRLQSLPTLGLPPSLERLVIYKCPLLEKQCRKGKGDSWPLVASIPAFHLQDFGSFWFKPQRLRK